MFYEPDFEKMSSFSSLNTLIFSSPEPQTIDFQLEINLRQTLINFSKDFQKNKKSILGN